MAADGTLKFDTLLDTSRMATGLSSLKNLVKTGVGVYIGKQIADIGKAGVMYNAEMEKFQTALTTSLKSSKEAARVMEQIKKDAAKTPFDVRGLTMAESALISTGESADGARSAILALGDAVAATGGGDDELQRMAFNLQQVRNTGKATAMDIRQFAIAGIDIYGILADYTGKTTEEIKNMEISYEDLSAALRAASEEGGRYYKGMEAQSKTLLGQLSSLKDNANQLLGELTDPIFEKLRNDILPGLADRVQWMMDNLPIVKGVIAAVTTELVLLKGVLIATSKNAQGVMLITLIFTGITKAVKTARNAMIAYALSVQLVGAKAATLNALKSALMWLAKFKWLLIGGGIMAIAGALAFLAASGDISGITEKIKSFAEKAGTAISNFAAKIPAIISGIAAALPQIIEALINAVITLLPLLIQAGIELMIALIKGIVTAIPQLIKAAPQIIEALINAVITLLPLLIQAGIELMIALIEGIATAIPQIVKAAPQIIAALLKGIVTLAVELVKAGPKIIAAIVKGIGQAVKELFKSGKKIIEAVGDGIDKAKDKVGKKVKEWAAKLPDMIIDGLGDLFDVGKKWIGSLWDGINGSGKKGKKAVTKEAKKMPKDFTKSLGSLKAPGSSWISSLNTGISPSFKRVSSSSANSATSLRKTTISRMGTLNAHGSSWITGLKNGMASLYSATQTATSSFGGGLPGRLRGGMGSVYGTGSTWIVGLRNGMASLYGTVRGSIRSFAAGLPGSVKSGLGSLVSIGKNWLEGLWNGINSKTRWLISKIKGVARNAKQAIKDFFGINSPSRVMRDEVGQYITLGLGEGIASRTKELLQTVDSQMAAVKEAYAKSTTLPPFNAIPASATFNAGGIPGGIANQETHIEQTVNFNQPVRMPSEVNRLMREQAISFGLAGGRA